jgi:hypothetical protein
LAQFRKDFFGPSFPHNKENLTLYARHVPRLIFFPLKKNLKITTGFALLQTF